MANNTYPNQCHKIFSVSQLLTAKLEAPIFTVSDLIPMGLTVFGGSPKSGKSWACLDMALSVSSGEPFLGLPTNQGSVLYVDLEDSYYRLKDRLTKLTTICPDSFDAVISAPQINHGLLNFLDEWIAKKQDARLVIVDTAQKVKSPCPRGQNAYESDYQQGGLLQRFAIDKKISIVLVTHVSKKKAIVIDDPFERLVGSSGFFAAADAGLMIIGKREDHIKTLFTTGRDIFDEQYKIEFDNFRWHIVGRAEEIAEQKGIESYKKDRIRTGIISIIQSKSDKKWSGTASDIQQLLNIDIDPKFIGRWLTENDERMRNVDGITLERRKTATSRIFTFQLQ